MLGTSQQNEFVFTSLHETSRKFDLKSLKYDQINKSTNQKKEIFVQKNLFSPSKVKRIQKFVWRTTRQNFFPESPEQ
jgi:hypothetical protein